MVNKIIVKVGELKLKAELYDTECAKALFKSLPIESKINTWGDEFYFSTKVKKDLDNTASRVVQIGDIGYWPPDNALCIFFGPTPASNGPDPVPASEVNIVGRITDDARELKKVITEKKIRVEKK
jgi:uncharacterized protein